MSDNEPKWLRKATLCEQIFEIGHQHKVYLTHYTLELASVIPIEEGLLKKALEHLYRKVPVLRVCLRERGSELWLCEMDKCVIDYKIANGGDVEKERDELTLQTYKTENGPLWRVRLVSLEESSIPPSSLSQQAKNAPYNYALIFGIHHALSDGFTNIKICNLLHNIIDNIMSGYPIDDEEQLGEFVGDEVICALYEKETSRLKKDPELCSKIKRDLDEGAKFRPLIRHICKIPADVVLMTRNVHFMLSKEATAAFQKKAKSEGVTLHSAITGLINLGLIDLMQESDLIEEEYNIRAGHDINHRKYYTGDTSHILGAHVPIFGYRSPFIAPKNMLPVFWDCVRTFNKSFRSDISDGAILTTTAYRLMTEDPTCNSKEMFKNDAEPNYYYTFSNMGNLTGILSEDGNCISITRLIRFSSLRSSSTFLISFAHTFRDQINISFAYSTKYLSHDFVMRLKERVELGLVSVCSM